MQKIHPFLWFDTEAEEAAKFYTSVFKNSRITNVAHYGDAGPMPAGSVMTVDFEIEGQPITALNAGPEFKFTEAISLFVNCETQDEVDYLWDKFTEDGGQESQCGWLKDKFGLSWQIVPEELPRLLQLEDKTKADRVMKAMMEMKKIETAKLRAAAEG
ncbi:MAG: VOC family protein [Actinomycetota bacterium]